MASLLLQAPGLGQEVCRRRRRYPTPPLPRWQPPTHAPTMTFNRLAPLPFSAWAAACRQAVPNPSAAHLCQLRLRQAEHQLHAVVAVGQVQAQHVGQQRAPPLPGSAAQVLQERGGANGAGEGGASVGAAMAWLGAAHHAVRAPACPRKPTNPACQPCLPLLCRAAAHLALFIQPALLEHALGGPRDALAAARKHTQHRKKGKSVSQEGRKL